MVVKISAVRCGVGEQVMKVVMEGIDMEQNRYRNNHFNKDTS
jgi:hypothetical protein